MRIAGCLDYAGKVHNEFAVTTDKVSGVKLVLKAFQRCAYQEFLLRVFFQNVNGDIIVLRLKEKYLIDPENQPI